MARIRICKAEDCHNAATTEGYCRLHYLRYWKKIKEDTRRKAAKTLNRYIEHVVREHPDRYVDVIKKDLRSPNFESFIDETFGEDDVASLFEEQGYDEEIEQLIKQLKIEKGY